MNRRAALRAALREAAGEIERLRADVDRLDWLADGKNGSLIRHWGGSWEYTLDPDCNTGRTLREAIDMARYGITDQDIAETIPPEPE